MRRSLIGLAMLVVACTTTTDTTPASSPGDVAAPTVTTPSSSSTSTVISQPDPLVCWTSEPAPGSPEISFGDVTAATGLVQPLTGMHGHAAAWGDVNGDDHPDLVIGTFANRPVERYQVRGADGPSPDTLLLGSDTGVFTRADAFPAVLGRTSGAAIADLDNDGDNDVVLSRNMRDRERGDAPTQIYRNDGTGFSLVDIDLGRLVSGRSVGVLDYDRDGFLDLLLIEDRFGGGRSSVLLRNEGAMTFTDETRSAGLPDDLQGLGIATSDLNGDDATDFFVGGSNRLFVARHGGFVEATSSVFGWEIFGDEDDVAGVSIGDLNRDGLPDLVVGHHYNSTLSQDRAVPIRVYLNMGNTDDGIPEFADVTDESGIIPLPTKAPHVEVADFDNDGWPDILTTASATEGTRPALLRNMGATPGGIPRFSMPDGLGDPQYWVAGPTADFDRDGRLDILLVEWEPTLPSLLLANQTASGNWLEVSVPGTRPVGTKVWVWEAGGMDDSSRLIGMREIVVTQGYTAGNLAVAHFGLGTQDEVDVRVVSHDGTSFTVTGVSANAHIRVPGGC